MVQTDYIMRIIEQFAAFLWAIVFNKKAQNYDIALEKINEAYNELLHLDGNLVKNSEVNEIIQNNTFRNILDKDNIEIIANLLYEEADIVEQINGKNDSSNDCYEKSVILFCKLFEKDNIKKYSEKIDGILMKLEKYGMTDNINQIVYKYYEINGLYGKAEDALYKLLENDYPDIKTEVKLFYNRLLEKNDIELEKGNLPRNEIMEELNKL